MAKFKNAQLSINYTEFPNIGIGYFEGNKVKVKNSLPKQVLDVNIFKKRRCYEGRIINVITKAEEEIEPKCKDFGICGGCTYQNIPYSYELKIKEDMVLSLLNKNNILNYEYLGIEGAPSIEAYRNKMEYSFGDEGKDGDLALGMRKRNSFYEVVTSKSCNIVDEDYRLILKCVLNYCKNSNETFYHKSRHEGALRHLCVRKGKNTKEILINLVTTSTVRLDMCQLVNKILSLSLDGSIVGIIHTINNSVADVIKPEQVNNLYGNGWFTDEILGLKFRISAFSFFQTNTEGAEKLYLTIKDFVSSSKEQIIFDLYCGTGTIAQILSTNAKEVIGIEIVEDAVEVAKQNAKLNNINNCRFIAGNVLEEVDNIRITPDIIVLDPPRDGIHPKAINKIIDFNANKIVYVSCKPTSLVRDLKIFIENGYAVEKVKIHDMFARTYHIETVVLLSKKL